MWHLQGKPTPPAKPIKILTIIKYAKKYNITNFVETGTYLGETIELTKKHFNKIYSIELGKKLYKNAKKNFAKNKKIKIYYGDSALILPKLIKKINSRSLFWLDAHHSMGITSKGTTETPILKELKSISRDKIKNHVILVDDARDFKGVGDYPTIKKVKQFVKKNFSDYKTKIESDIILIYPNE